MEENLRDRAGGYLRAARGGWGKPEKFSVESLFHLGALAIEGYLIAWLETRDAAPSHHGFRSLVAAFETRAVLPAEVRAQLLSLDGYQRLCEWIPVEPRKPVRDDIPGLLDLADRVGELTRG
ncbi:MAG TPA: hypothetical protein VMB23_00510 [Spirochaetia bacterium]|nr:hypothetical protein [Spirochaetia bacterium]